MVVYRLLLAKDLFQAFYVVQSTYNNCYNTHSISDTELWPLKVSQAQILRELRHALNTRHSSKVTCLCQWTQEEGTTNGEPTQTVLRTAPSQVVDRREGQQNTKPFSTCVIQQEPSNPHLVCREALQDVSTIMYA